MMMWKRPPNALQSVAAAATGLLVSILFQEQRSVTKQKLEHCGKFQWAQLLLIGTKKRPKSHTHVRKWNWAIFFSFSAGKQTDTTVLHKETNYCRKVKKAFKLV